MKGGIIPTKKYDFCNPLKYFTVYSVFKIHNPILECGCKFTESMYGILHEFCLFHRKAYQQCRKCEMIKLTDELEIFKLK